MGSKKVTNPRLGAFLKAEMIGANLNATQLAVASGVQYNVITALTRGETAVPSPDVANPIVAQLNCSMEEFLTAVGYDYLSHDRSVSNKLTELWSHLDAVGRGHILLIAQSLAANQSGTEHPPVGENHRDSRGLS